MEHYWGPRSAKEYELTKGRWAVWSLDYEVRDAPKFVKDIVKLALTHVHRKVANVDAGHGYADRGRRVASPFSLLFLFVWS